MPQHLGRVEGGAEHRAAVGEEALRQLGALVRGDVLDDVDRHRHGAGAVRDRGGLHGRPALLAGCAHAEAHDHLAEFALGERAAPGQLVHGEGAAALVEQLEAAHDLRQRRGDQRLARLVAEQLHRGFVREQKPAVGCLGGDGVGDAAQDGLELVAGLGCVHSCELLQAKQLLALPLGAAAVGDVADRAGEHRRVRALDRVDRELDRELDAVGAQADQLDALAQQGGLARLDHPAQRRAVALAEARRDDQLRHLGAHRILDGVPEDLLRRRVELDHPALVVDGDDPVERRGDDGALARLAEPDRLADAEALDELADEDSDGVGERDQLGIRRPDLASEELDHRDALAPDAHRERRAAAQTVRAGGLGARVPRIGRVVLDPARTAGLPHARGQRELALGVELPGGLREARRTRPPRPSRTRPGAAGSSSRDSQRFPVDHPRGAPIASSSSGRGLLERPRLRQHAGDAVLHAKPGGVELALGAQLRHAGRQGAHDRHRGNADEVLGRAEGVAREADRDRREEGDQPDDGGVARGGAERGDDRAHHEQLHEHGVRLDGEVERGDEADGHERSEEHAPLVAKSRRVGMRAQPV